MQLTSEFIFLSPTKFVSEMIREETSETQMIKKENTIILTRTY